MLPRGVGYPAAKEIEFAELGHSLDNFAVKAGFGGKVVLGLQVSYWEEEDPELSNRRMSQSAASCVELTYF